jgi:hypothetical protein
MDWIAVAQDRERRRAPSESGNKPSCSTEYGEFRD